MANNFDWNYHCNPPCSWLDYYRISIEQYQKHVPDLRKNTSERKTRIRPPPVQSSSKSDAESESKSSNEDYIPPVIKMKEKSHTSEDTTQEVKTDSGHLKKEDKGKCRTCLP